jgi:hypothetical protein
LINFKIPIIFISLIFLTFLSLAPSECQKGIYNNCNFSQSPESLSQSAKERGGDHGVIDLVVVQAHDPNFAYLPFPYEKNGYIYGNKTDHIEPYLSQAEKDGRQVILSIQPNSADITELIDIILARYAHHKNIIGVNVDLEWKLTGEPNHASNSERDLWLRQIKGYNPEYKLFLTYFKDYTYFPDDTEDMVILFDGEEDTQDVILREYSDLAKHFSNVGIYTGYRSSKPQKASDDAIFNAAPNTKYIIYV